MQQSRFQLKPAQRFTESDISEKYEISRTPIRQALYRFEQEGCVNVHFRSGWEVKPWDFKFYNELFDLRMILEKEAVKRLCEMDHETSEELQALKRIWLVPVEEYKQESKQLIFVLPEYRRQGIATELCQLLFAYAQQQNIQHLYLHTHPFLPAAEKFWRLQSFSTVSREQLGMYDTIHMLKRLCL